MNTSCLSCGALIPVGARKSMKPATNTNAPANQNDPAPRTKPPATKQPAASHSTAPDTPAKHKAAAPTKT